MIQVSSEYKNIMSRYTRNRAYISVGIGIINQNAQENASASANSAYWSYGSIFDANKEKVEYATLEEDYMRVDGSMVFVPENDEMMQLKSNGITTDEVLGSVRIEFNNVYAIKGITLEFGSAYPTEFEIVTAEKTLTYQNDSQSFVTMDVLGDTSYIIINPISMIGGQQRFRIKSVLMGVGLQYSEKQIKAFDYDDEASSISDELPSEDTKFSFFDEKKLFDVEDDNSFITFLETMQEVKVSFGLEMDDGSVEWHQVATNYLKSWKSQDGIVEITATDRLSQMDDEYSLGNRIYERTAYQEAESIFADAGLQPDQYSIDDYLNDVTLINPMPIGTHRECLQLLANASRCVLRQDPDGRIVIRANFARVLEPDDLKVSTNGHTTWSKPDNILIGTEVVYAELAQDFMAADGSMYFLPEDESYLETSYVSKQIADENGNFTANPAVTLVLPAAYTYYGVNVLFDGNTPAEMIVHTYNDNVLIESVRFDSLTKNSYLSHEFVNFDKMVFEVTKGVPYNRVLINRISFGELTDYVLTKTNMMNKPAGYRDAKIKSVNVKIFTYVENEDGEPEEVEDSVFSRKSINAVGTNKYLRNPLVGTEEHAALLAEWLGVHYSGDTSYDVKYRGEPRIKASDVIFMETEAKGNVQLEILRNNIGYNGVFSGNLELRKAVNLNGG